MKKLMTILLVAVLLASCDKFLDLKPENIKVVSTVEDYRDLLASYMRYLKTPNRTQMTVLGGYYYPAFDVANAFAYRTGELTPNKESSYYDATLGEYTTAGVKRLTWEETTNLWNTYYSFLGPINMIIGGIETAEGEDERLRDYVKGEALVWRAYSYLKLLQYYSPYKTGNEYGVPIYLKPYEDPGNTMPARETQTTVYQQILSDCEEVLKLLERTPSTNWNCAYEPVFVHSLLAHVYWYKAMSVTAEETDWQNALEHAEFAMKGRTFVYDPTVFASMFDATAGKEFTNDEFNVRLIDGTRGYLVNVMNKYYQGSLVPYAETAPDPDFYALFKDDDVRKQAYFRTQLDNTVKYDKYNISANSNLAVQWGLGSAGGIIMLFRSAEMQLIKAETLYRLGREGEAREALNFFKQGRYLDIEGSYTESDLLSEILKERKLEFYHEQDMWWLDMKRQGTRMERVVNGTLYVLEPDDFRWCFPIPNSELEANKNMVQTPGWDEVDF